MVDFSINILTEIMAVALPIAFVFEIGNLIIGIFMRAAFGGRLWLGK